MLVELLISGKGREMNQFGSPPPGEEHSKDVEMDFLSICCLGTCHKLKLLVNFLSCYSSGYPGSAVVSLNSPGLRFQI